MQGLLLSDGESVKLMDESLNQGNKSAVIPVEFKKDGTFSARSQVANQSEWEVLRGSVRSQISRIGKRIVDGDVAITPYRLDKRSPCTYCDFRPVCHFDSQVEGNPYQSLSKPRSREELWQRLAKDAQRGEPH
jgi:ATP-dependent helicase/nuclease subunit B